MKVRLSQADAAEALIRELVEDGPIEPRRVRALAEERGLEIGETAWLHARRRVDGLETTRIGRRHYWSLSTGSIEDELAAWLETPAGRFARYVAERDRILAAVDPGEQLRLEDAA